MTDVGTTTTRKTREIVADRQWVDVGNNVVDSPEQATGIRYIDLETKKAFIYQTGLPAGHHATMLAGFGALTKAGNIRSTLVNTKGEGGDTIVQGIEDWFQILIEEGTWSADRVGGGMRFNAEVLARAIAHAKGERHEGAHQPYLDKINSRAKVLDPGDKSGKKEILYSTFAYRNNAVKQQYHATLPADSAAPATGDL